MKKRCQIMVSLLLVLFICLQPVPAFAEGVGDFRDVPTNHWAYSSIAYVINKGYMGETDDGLFEPDATASRAMIITTIYRIANEPAITVAETPFPDVALNMWYTKPIAWAKSIGIINGHDDGTFRPTDNMPREQIALIMYRYASYCNYDLSTSGANIGEFPDFFDTPIGCQTAMRWAIKKGMFIGKDGYLLPNAYATRAELATCLHRFNINDAPVTGISFSSASYTKDHNWSGYLNATISPYNAGNKAVYWSSSNQNVATVSVSTGLITIRGAGKTTITARTEDGNYQATCKIIVNTPNYFHQLISTDDLTYADIKRTDDHFCISTKSIADILLNNDITALIDSNNNIENVATYFDDWYMYAILKETDCVYGLFKMREEETNPHAHPGVTISFIEFDTTYLKNCIANPSNTNKISLSSHIATVVEYDPESTDVHNIDIYNYFSNVASSGSYLIADEYVEFIGKNAVNNLIDVPIAYASTNSTIKNAVANVNTNANYSVVEEIAENKFVIHIQNPSYLTKHEKYAILLTHTANLNYYSFAAEVLLHAEGLEKREGNVLDVYESLIRADMTINTDRIWYESIFEFIFGYDDYNELESTVITNQKLYHNENDWL